MVLTLRRATRPALPMPEIPDTMMQNTIGAIIMPIKLMKPSPGGFIFTAVSGQTAPNKDRGGDGDDHLIVKLRVKWLGLSSQWLHFILRSPFTANVCNKE